MYITSKEKKEGLKKKSRVTAPLLEQAHDQKPETFFFGLMAVFFYLHGRAVGLVYRNLNLMEVTFMQFLLIFDVQMKTSEFFFLETPPLEVSMKYSDT